MWERNGNIICHLVSDFCNTHSPTIYSISKISKHMKIQYRGSEKTEREDPV